MAGALGTVAIFEGVPELELASLEAAAEALELGAFAVVFEPEAACDGLYLVRRGGVVIRQQVVGQPIERIRDVGPGDLFGEIEVLDGSRRQFQARTLGATGLLRLPQDALWTFLRRHPIVESRLRTLAIYRRTSRLHALLAPATRLDPRIRIDRPIDLVQEGRPAVAARLEDLSHGGACLSGAPAGWRPGDLVRFRVGYRGEADLLDIEAKVRWRMHDLVGLIFESSRAPQKARRQIDRALRVLLAPAPPTPPE